MVLAAPPARNIWLGSVGTAHQDPGAKPDAEAGLRLLLGAEQGKEAKNGLAAPLAASEGRSDSVSLLERGGSTFSVESGDGVPELRRSFQVPGAGQGVANNAVARMCSASLVLAWHQRKTSRRRCIASATVSRQSG